MNWLARSHCGRFHHCMHPSVLDDLGKDHIALLCQCGHTDAWVWTSKAPLECGVTELRAMRAAAERETAKNNLRAAAFAAAIPRVTEGCAGSSPVFPRPSTAPE